MRNWLLVFLMMVATLSYGGEVTFNGVACTEDWKSDIYLNGDASGYPGTSWITISYHASEWSGRAWYYDKRIEGGDPEWSVLFKDLVCEGWYHLGDTSGLITIYADWEFKGNAITYHPNPEDPDDSFGGLIKEARSIPRQAAYKIPPTIPQNYRVNVLLFIDDENGSQITVGSERVFIPGRESVILTRVPPGTRIVIDRGEGFSGPMFLTFSQVNNGTNDPINIPAEDWRID